MQALEDFFNKIADADWTWWPLLSLRPAKDQKLDNIRLLKLTAFFGAFTGGGLFCIGTALGKIYLSPWNALYLLAVCSAFIFLFCKFILAFFWNRRAARLQK